MPEKTTPVSAYFDQALLTKLEAVAKADNRSLSYVIVQAVRELVAKQEHVVKWRQMDIAEQIAAAVQRPPVTTAAKQAQHRTNMAARSARVAQRMAKHK